MLCQMYNSYKLRLKIFNFFLFISQEEKNVSIFFQRAEAKHSCIQIILYFTVMYNSRRHQFWISASTGSRSSSPRMSRVARLYLDSELESSPSFRSCDSDFRCSVDASSLDSIWNSVRNDSVVKNGSFVDSQITDNQNVDSQIVRNYKKCIYYELTLS
jgi:hypothetical protein